MLDLPSNAKSNKNQKEAADKNNSSKMYDNKKSEDNILVSRLEQLDPACDQES